MLDNLRSQQLQLNHERCESLLCPSGEDELRGLVQARAFVSYLRAYDTRGSWRAGLALETLLEKGKRERDDTSAKQYSSEGHRLPPDCSSSGETTDREGMDTRRQKKQETKQKVENTPLYIYTGVKQRKKKRFSKLSSAVLMQVLWFG